MVLVFHVILQDHVTKLGGNSQSGSEDIMILVCHVIKVSCGLMVRSPSKQVNILLSLVVIATLAVEI